jgi:hypothetical protein
MIARLAPDDLPGGVRMRGAVNVFGQPDWPISLPGRSGGIAEVGISGHPGACGPLAVQEAEPGDHRVKRHVAPGISCAPVTNPQGDPRIRRTETRAAAMSAPAANPSLNRCAGLPRGTGKRGAATALEVDGFLSHRR